MAYLRAEFESELAKLQASWDKLAEVHQSVNNHFRELAKRYDLTFTREEVTIEVLRDEGRSAINRVKRLTQGRGTGAIDVRLLDNELRIREPLSTRGGLIKALDELQIAYEQVGHHIVLPLDVAFERLEGIIATYRQPLGSDATWSIQVRKKPDFRGRV